MTIKSLLVEEFLRKLKSVNEELLCEPPCVEY